MHFKLSGKNQCDTSNVWADTICFVITMFKNSKTWWEIPLSAAMKNEKKVSVPTEFDDQRAQIYM